MADDLRQRAVREQTIQRDEKAALARVRSLHPSYEEARASECVLCLECAQVAPCRTRRELDALVAARGEELEHLHLIARVRAAHAAIHADMDAYVARHNPDCDCDTIPATRETADRMLAALDSLPEDSAGR